MLCRLHVCVPNCLLALCSDDTHTYIYNFAKKMDYFIGMYLTWYMEIFDLERQWQWYLHVVNQALKSIVMLQAFRQNIISTTVKKKYGMWRREIKYVYELIMNTIKLKKLFCIINLTFYYFGWKSNKLKLMKGENWNKKWWFMCIRSVCEMCANINELGPPI